MPEPVCFVPSVVWGTQEGLKLMSVGRMNRGHQQSSCLFTAHPEPPAGTAMGRIGKRAEVERRKPNLPSSGPSHTPSSQ